MKTMGQLPMEVRLSREKHLQLKRVAEFERRYEMIMPITASVDEGQCRDEFVRKFCDNMQFVDINDEDSDSEEQSPRLSRKMTLDSFLMSARRILRTAETVDKFTYWEADPQRFCKMTGETGRYDELLESMKLSSLSYLFSRVIDRLRLLEGISLEHTEMDLHDLPHQIFKWSMEAFFNRVSLSDPVYLEVLQLDYPEEVLEWAKLSEDIGEMVRFFSYFQMEMFTSDKKNYQRLQTILYDQMQLLNIADEMDKTLQKSVRRFDTLEDKAHKALAAFKDIKREYLIEQCTQSSAEALVLLPIEWRYVRDSYATLVEMQSHKDKLPVQQLEKQIADLRKRMEDQQKSSSEVSLVYKLVIEVCIINFYRCLTQANVRFMSTELSKASARIRAEALRRRHLLG